MGESTSISLDDQLIFQNIIDDLKNVPQKKFSLSLSKNKKTGSYELNIFCNNTEYKEQIPGILKEMKNKYPIKVRGENNQIIIYLKPRRK